MLKLTRTGGEPIWIVIRHIVSVTEINGETNVLTTAHGDDKYAVVDESVDHVVTEMLAGGI